jgi:nitrogen-specific signal transduction histidine kinase/HAMP domain-containing protein
MKLFVKTLLFFIGVIAFQAVLTILFLTEVMERTNLEEAKQELSYEASILYDSFNSWKRQIWMSLIAIQNDERLARFLASSRGYLPEEDVSASLKEFLVVSKIDHLLLATPGGSLRGTLPATYATFSTADLKNLRNEKTHPYIELRYIQAAPYIIGITGINLGREEPIHVFLLKRIDQDFFRQLILNRKSQIALFHDGRYVSGSFVEAAPETALESESVEASYLERYNEKIGGGRYNIAFQRIGTLDTERLYLATFLSNDPYNRKILQVSRAVLLISLAGALFTLLLSLFFSRNITRPIAELLKGMERVKAGAYSTQVGFPGGYEISRLFEGFNTMAGKLHQSQMAMKEYVQETVLLKEYNEKIINSIQAAIAIVNRELIVETANHFFLDFFDLEGRTVIGKKLLDLGLDIVDQSIADKMGAIFAREQDSHSEVKRSGNNKVYEIKLYPFYSSGEQLREASGCVFMIDDVSEKTELEHKIFRAEKLASISMLSAGMAHEINNPLSSMLTNVQNLIADESDPERRISLKWIERETRRIAGIVRQLLNFTATDSLHAPGAEVNTVVEETIGLIRCSFASEKRIKIDTRLAAGLPPAVMNRDELGQVTLNLIKNAVQAIPGEGRILVCTHLNGGRICLSVADSGGGIPKDVIPRIFDPFFTTKDNGEGTGLGLSVVYGIITKYGGRIDVRSHEARGTRIGITLPAMGRGGGE